MSRSEQPDPGGLGDTDGDRSDGRERRTWRIERERHVEEWAALLDERVE